MNCLALTGVDSTVPLVVGVALLLVGAIVVGVVVWRRNRRAGGALLLALLLAAGTGSLLAAPQPAQAASESCSAAPAAPADPAAPNDPAAPADPTTPCTPIAAVPDVTATARDVWQAGSTAGVKYLPLDAPSATAWQQAVTAIQAIEPSPTLTPTLVGTSGGATNSVTSGAVSFIHNDTPSDAVGTVLADFDAAIQGLTDPTVTASVGYTYPDGCGGRLTTTLTVAGTFPTPPPVCTPAVAVDAPAISETSDWFPVDATHEGLVLTAGEAQQLTSEVAAIQAIDPAAAIVSQGVNLYNGSTFAPSPWTLVGTTFEVSRAAYDTVVAGIDSGGGVFFAFQYQYADGCGGTLGTLFSVLGDFAPIIT